MIDRIKQIELRKKYNPDNSKLRQLQLRQLEILRFINDICITNEIKYWLAGGTCLGAVRHGGFIPWDDDIDIEMMEEDYFKFQKIMANLNHKQFIFQNMKNDPNYFFSFGKVRDLNSRIYEISGCDKNYKYKGCYVDVFPIAYSNSEKLNRLGRFIGVLLAKTSQKENKLILYGTKATYKVLIPILRYLSSIGNRKKLRYNMGCPIFNTFKSDYFSETIFMNFEGYMFPIPKNYQSYLIDKYGNYQDLPKEKDIHIHLANFELY